MNALTPVAGPLDGLSPEEVIERIASDWHWRITSGALYLIKTKGTDDPEDPGVTAPFLPNTAQLRLLDRLHNRNLILKARQLGFTTLITILGLDQALFNANQNVVIQAHTEDAAEEIFRDKIKFAYDHLPEQLRAIFPLKKANESQLVFEHNGSSIRVVVSARSGTSHFLHVSEMGKVAAQYPEKAREIVTGSLQALPLTGLGFIESTAEGQGGAFYELARRAEAKHQACARLSPADWRFHFFGWWVDPGYRLPPDEAARVPIGPKDHEYFDHVEAEVGITLDAGQRAWYIAKRDEEFAHEPTLMWREYPSTPDECWRTGTEGKYLVHVLAKARIEERIGRFPLRRDRPVNGFWDLGASDTQVLWLNQKVGQMTHWNGHRASNTEGLLPFVLWVDSLEVPVGTMYLPHDASNLINGIESPSSLVSQARRLRPSWRWVVVPRVRTIQHGIDLMRAAFETYCFDEEACKDGLVHLSNYRRNWNKRLAAWGDEPEHDEASHHADALRQHAQAVANFGESQSGRPRKPAPAATGWTV